MLKHVKSIIAKLPTTMGKVIALATFLILFLSLPMVSANAGTMQPIAAIGMKHQAEGALNQGVGKAEQATAGLKGETKGLARQIDGKAKRDIGRVESKAAEFANSSNRKATDLGDQIQDAAGSLANSVKDLVK